MLHDIPYQCARCGGIRTFNTIAELKSHMADEHTYGGEQRRQRFNIFDYKSPAHSAGLGRHSPVLQSYLDEGRRLEEEVKQAKTEELNNKFQRYQQIKPNVPHLNESLLMRSGTTSKLSAGEVTMNFKSPTRRYPEPEAHLQETLNTLNQEVMTQRHNNWQMADTLYQAQEVLAGVEEAAENRVMEQKNLILQLSKELAAKECQIQRLNSELEKLQHNNRIKKNQTEGGADEKPGEVRKDTTVIEEEILKKKAELEHISSKLFKAKKDLKNRKQKDTKRGQKQDDAEQQVKVPNFDRNVATDSSYISTEEELSDYSTTHASYNLSKTFSSAARDRSPNLNRPKHDKVVKNELRQHRLDHQRLLHESPAPSHSYVEQVRAEDRAERQELIQRMKEMLSKAASDNEKLKDKLVAKENQLHSMNFELEKSKTDQTELMKETYDLYCDAEKNLTKLKEMLKVKETQLDLANSRLEEFHSLQDQLTKEKEAVAEDAKDKDVQIQNLVKERDEQIERLSSQLVHFQAEQDRLSAVATDLKKEVLAKEKTQEDLQKSISDKEQELQKAKEDLGTLSTFLQTAAAKESVARSKLETFVTELIDRADKAEQELQTLRRTFGTSNVQHADPSSAAMQASGSVFSASLPTQPYTLSSTPMSPLGQSQRLQPLHPYGDQVLQTSLEPWYKNLGLVKDSGQRPTNLQTGVDEPEQPIRGIHENMPPTLHPSICSQQSRHLPSHSQVTVDKFSRRGYAGRQQPRAPRSSSGHGAMTRPDREASLAISDSSASEEFAALPARRPVPKQRKQLQDLTEARPARSSPQVAAKSKSRAHMPRSPSHFGSSRADGEKQRRLWPDHNSDDDMEQELCHSDSSASHSPHPQHEQHRYFSRSPGAEKKMTRRRNKINQHQDLMDGQSPASPPDRQINFPKKHFPRREGTCSLPENPALAGDVAALSPNRTYTVLSVSGLENQAPDMLPALNSYSTDLELSESVSPVQKSSSYHDKQQLWKGKRSSLGSQGQQHLKQIVTAENSSMGGLELSLDEDGIMWEPADLNSDAFNSFRMSPYGSETTGDVDSSVLRSSRSHTNSRSIRGDDTDDDVADLQEEDSSKMFAFLDKKQDVKATASVPLGERISKILKCVTKDEMSEPSTASSKFNGESRPARNQKKQESPLERAMAVRARVKSLTLPRAGDKAALDSLPSDMVQKNLDMGEKSEQTTKQRAPSSLTAQTPATYKPEPDFDTLDDFSSSSYASVNAKPSSGKPIAQAAGEEGERDRKKREKDVDKASSKLQLAVFGSSQGSDCQLSSASPDSLEKKPLAKLDRAPNLLEYQHQRILETRIPPEAGIAVSAHADDALAVGRDQNQVPIEMSRGEAVVTSDGLDRDAMQKKKQSTTGSSPFARQASVMLEEHNLEQFENAILKPAKELRARFMVSHSSSEDSSLQSLSLPAQPMQSTHQDDESTDFDFDYDLESDLQNISGFGIAGAGSGRCAPSGRSVVKKVRALQRRPRVGRSAGTRCGKQSVINDITDDSSSVASDTDLGVNRQQEEKRRRRIALFCVFSYLDVSTLGIVALVCKEWRRVSRHPALWKHVHIKYKCISSKFLITISKWCTQLTSLKLEGLRAGQRQAGETLDEYNRRTKACLEPGLEELLKVSQDTLTNVSIMACSNILTDKCLWLVSGYCRLLERLTYISDMHPLTAEVMWALGGGCPSITSLIVPPLHAGTLKQGLTNRCLLLMAQFYPDLLQAGIGGDSLDATGLVPLVQSCQRLQFLSLSHVKELQEDTVAAMCKAGLRQLQRLELKCIPLKPEVIKIFYNSCRHLTEVKVVVSIQDYWEDTRKKKNREEYKKTVTSLEELKSQAGLGNILRLQVASVD